jgi:ankyrin repeat protein
MKLSVVLSLCMFLSFSETVFAEKLPVEAERMLNDLGSTEDLQKKNNGKTFRCRYGGYKTVSVSPLADAALFSGDYDNCREAGSTRDGYFEVIVQDWEVVGESSRRSKNGELQDAVRKGDVKKARELITKRADVNYAEDIPVEGGGSVSNWTPLMSAAMTGNAELIKLLIKAGARVNFMNSRAVSALWLAAGSGSIESVRLLVTSGAYINNSNYEDVTPLMMAAMNGHYQVAKYLVDSGADINGIHKDGDSALMFALANKHTKIAQLIIDSGADINIRNRFGATALLIAVSENNEEMVRNLIRLNADLTVRTESGKTVLDIALAKGNQDIIEMIRQAQTGIR